MKSLEENTENTEKNPRHNQKLRGMLKRTDINNLYVFWFNCILEKLQGV